MADITEAKAFLAEYEELCRRHDLMVSACGCCDSPWVMTPDDVSTIEKDMAHLTERAEQDFPDPNAEKPDEGVPEHAAPEGPWYPRHREMVADLDTFYGRGHGEKLNPAYGDGYFAVSLKEKYGMDVEELVAITGYEVPDE